MSYDKVIYWITVASSGSWNKRLLSNTNMSANYPTTPEVNFHQKVSSRLESRNEKSGHLTFCLDFLVYGWHEAILHFFTAHLWLHQTNHVFSLGTLFCLCHIIRLGRGAVHRWRDLKGTSPSLGGRGAHRCLRLKFYYKTQMSCDMTKPTKWLCAQRRLRSAWASAQSDRSLRWALNG